MEDEIEDLLARVHDASGSSITANSRRLCSLRNLPDALETCRKDVKAIQSLYPEFPLLLPSTYLDT